jgi:hypothetical protein
MATADGATPAAEGTIDSTSASAVTVKIEGDGGVSSAMDVVKQEALKADAKVESVEDSFGGRSEWTPIEIDQDVVNRGGAAAGGGGGLEEVPTVSHISFALKNGKGLHNKSKLRHKPVLGGFMIVE